MCGCGKTRGTIDRPLVAGRPNGAEAIEMRLLINFGGVAAGTDVWVTGDGVDLWLAKGYAAAV